VREQLRALLQVRSPKRLHAYNQAPGKAAAFAAALKDELGRRVH
jgi:ornithine cyclodeaminase/alanine dehydrogenase-like protein (mu-crystallin family)